MNQRIKELVEQMGWEEMGVDLADLYGKTKDGCMTTHAIEKFAKLIVQECAEVASDYDGANYVGTEIKKHFGVEE